MSSYVSRLLLKPVSRSLQVSSVRICIFARTLSMYASGRMEKDSADSHIRVIDMRSDTVTKPTAEMRVVMADAPVGDDVFGDDPSVNNLQVKAAKLFGKEAGLFVPSGSMGNLLSIMSHCPHRGDEILVGDRSHIAIWEQGSAAQFAGVYSRHVKTHPDGRLDLDDMQSKIHDGADAHYTHTKVICLENTHNATGGTVLPLDYLEKVKRLADEFSLQVHLDGARVFNAATALGVPVSAIAQHTHSVMFCLSKGLGAPVGSMIVAGKDFIARCHRHRKALGGGMRQAGILAAAGIYSLDNIVPKLINDHENAKTLAKGLLQLPGLAVNIDRVQSNLLYFDVIHDKLTAEEVANKMGTITPTEPQDTQAVVRMLALNAKTIRAVFHHQVSHEDVRIFLKKMKHILSTAG